jgi:hypothetical protein
MLMLMLMQSLLSILLPSSSCSEDTGSSVCDTNRYICIYKLKKQVWCCGVGVGVVADTEAISTR